MKIGDKLFNSQITAGGHGKYYRDPDQNCFMFCFDCLM